MEGAAAQLLDTVPARTTKTITVTDSDNVALIAENGISMIADSVLSDGATDRYNATGLQMTVTYDNTAEPPDIELTAPIDLSNHVTDEALTVSWTYAQDDGAAQTGSIVEASTDDGMTWTTVATTTSDVPSSDVPANTFGVGQVILRLTVSSAYASSEPVTVRVNMRANPATSNVSCDGLPHPTVSWTGVDQTAYQVRFDTWDSGARFGAETELTIPRVYAAGVYPVTVRTQTSNGDWSDWSETLWVEITNVDPGLTAALTVTQSGASALCSWTAAAGAAGYILLRDGAAIWAGTDTWYRDDFAGAGAAVYTLRILAETGYYTDSAPVTAALQLRCDVLRPLDDAEAGWLKIRYSLAPRSRSYDRSIATTFRHYAGRPKPVAISDGASTRTMRTTAAFKTRAEADALLALAGRPVLYKDYNGGTIIGILDPVGTDSERVYSADLSVTEIDWPDELDAQVEAIYV